MTFDKFDSSSKAHRAVTSTARSRECRKRKKLGLVVRKVRINSGTVKKLVALGYLERGGEKKRDHRAGCATNKISDHHKERGQAREQDAGTFTKTVP